ncbi:MAG: hypothetical protein F4081_02330 [Dehalococcoidia bacterium]|nr:hypothetical protein [Dehalococcoidia bacterium]
MGRGSTSCGSGPCRRGTTSVTDPLLDTGVRYEPDERPPVALTLGAGLQAALVVAAPVVITVAIVARIAGQSDAYIAFAAFAALLASGAATVLQAMRVGYIGSGHVLITGTSGAFIAVCVAALVEGGPALMASLIVVSSLVYFQFAQNLAPLRRVFTPAVSGTVVMLVAATVLPIVFETVREVPADAPEGGAPLVALTTLVVLLAFVLRGPPALRLWAPVAGVAAGCAVAVPYGLYDTAPVADAAWLGAPLRDWPGVQIVPDRTFWTLLPAFVAVTIAVAVATVGDGIAIQRVSRREPRTTDFHAVRGALNAGGVGNLLSGLLGTLPGATHSSSIASAEATGVAARRVGVVIGAALLALAFLPKAAAALIAIPPAVAAAYIVVLLGLLFVRGMRLVLRDGLDHRTAAVAGVSFWLGVAFQHGWIFPGLIEGVFAEALLGNGITAGTLAAVLMTAFIKATGPRRRRLRVPLDGDAADRLDAFLGAVATHRRWGQASEQRLQAAGEEALWALVQRGDPGRELAVSARPRGRSFEVEFAAVAGGDDAGERLAYLDDLPSAPGADEVSLSPLRRHASHVRHRRYHGADVITVTVAVDGLAEDERGL